MKRLILPAMGFLLLFTLAACGGQQGLVDMEMVDEGGRSAIIWDDRTYYAFCVVSKDVRGEQIGYINGDRDDRISRYKDYPPEEWIMSWLLMDGGAMLYKEETVIDIPDGLEAEYN